jgi:hypothetical protein
VGHQYGFLGNRSIADTISCIRQILEKKLEYNETVHQLFIYFKKAFDSVMREMLYNILIDMRFAVLPAMTVKDTVFFDVAQCGSY